MKKIILCSSLISAFAIGHAAEIAGLSSTIPMHTVAEQKVLNEAYCNKLGSVDATKYPEIPANEKAVLGIACRVTDYKKFMNTIPYATAGNLDANGMPEFSNVPNDDVVRELSMFNATSGGRIDAFVPGGTVSKDYAWYAQGIGYYSDVYGSAVVLATDPQFPGCYTEPGYGQMSGGNPPGIFSVLRCGAALKAGSTTVYASACLNGQVCAHAQGIIQFN